jgi:hypothetical protein
VAEEGVMYYIKVNGLGGQIGDFGLTVTTLNPPPNDECSGAIEMRPYDFIEGSELSDATSESVPYCDTWDDGTPGVWYSVFGTDTVLRASVFSDSWRFYYASLTVFSGSCNNLYCETIGIESYDYDEGGLEYNSISATWSAPGRDRCTTFWSVEGRRLT